MITAYTYQDQQLKIIELTIEDGLPEQTLWLDLYKPDDDERDWLSRYSVEEVPDEEDINEIEASARFYQNKDGLHINSLFPQRVGQDVRGVNVSFNLRSRFLVTIREEDVGLIRLLRNYLRLGRIMVATPQALFIELFNLKVEYLSDLIEDVYTVLENVGEQVFESNELDDVFKLITLQEDSNGKIRLSLLDTQGLCVTYRSITVKSWPKMSSRRSARCCRTSNLLCLTVSLSSTNSTSYWMLPWVSVACSKTRSLKSSRLRPWSFCRQP